MVSPERLRGRIVDIFLEETHSGSSFLYIDFATAAGPRWYLVYVKMYRSFGTCRRIDGFGDGNYVVPKKLRKYLISIIPPDILASCIAASLGAAPPPD